MKEILNSAKGKIAAAVVILAVSLLATACTSVNSTMDDIGLDEAFAVALAHAEVTESDVELTKSRKDTEGALIVYEFDFMKDNVSYEYDVNGTTGEIMEFSREIINKKGNDDAGTNQAPAADKPNSGNSGSTVSPDAASSGSDSSGSGSSGSSASYIGADKAKSIALENAGVKTSAAVFTAAKLDRDDGRYLYEIDFYTSDTEYDYEIDAITGKILDRDSEPLDDWDDEDWDD